MKTSREFSHFLFIFLLICLFFPINVVANITCNDGTIITSCNTCSRGCCSYHGGCSNNSNNYNKYNDNDNNDNKTIDDVDDNNKFNNVTKKENYIVDKDFKFAYLEIRLIASFILFIFYLFHKGNQLKEKIINYFIFALLNIIISISTIVIFSKSNILEIVGYIFIFCFALPFIPIFLFDFFDKIKNFMLKR